MQNVVITMCEKIHYDRLRNDKALADRKSVNNNSSSSSRSSSNKNNVRSAWRPVSGFKKQRS